MKTEKEIWDLFNAITNKIDTLTNKADDSNLDDIRLLQNDRAVLAWVISNK